MGRCPTEALAAVYSSLKTRPALCLAGTSVIAIGIFLRCYGLDYNFDHDEVFSVHIARAPFSQMIRASLADRAHPPLHYGLLWAWVHLVGSTEVKVRLLSILLSTGFLSLVWCLSLRIVSPWVSILPVFLCSISPFFVFYGEQARPYALIQLFATLTLYCLVRAFEEPRSRNWTILYGLSCVGLLYSQYMGLFLLAGHLTLAIVADKELRTRILTAAILAIGGLAPWLAASVLQQSGRAQPWVPAWIARPSPAAIVTAYVDFFGTFALKGTTRILLLLSVVVLAYLTLHWRTVLAWRTAPLTTTAGLPVLAAFLVSEYSSVSIWAERQLIGSAVSTMCLVSVAVDASPKWVAWLLVIGFGGWVSLAAPSSLPALNKPPYRAVVAQFSGQNHPLVGIEEWVVLPLQHYSPRPVRYLGDPTLQQESAVTLVCRTVNCDQLRLLEPEYDIVFLRSFTWTRTPDPSSTLEVYALTRNH